MIKNMKNYRYRMCYYKASPFLDSVRYGRYKPQGPIRLLFYTSKTVRKADHLARA